MPRVETGVPGSRWSGSRLVPEGGEVLKGGRGTWQIVTVPGDRKGGGEREH